MTEKGQAEAGIVGVTKDEVVKSTTPMPLAERKAVNVTNPSAPEPIKLTEQKVQPARVVAQAGRLLSNYVQTGRAENNAGNGGSRGAATNGNNSSNNASEVLWTAPGVSVSPSTGEVTRASDSNNNTGSGNLPSWFVQAAEKTLADAMGSSSSPDMGLVEMSMVAAVHEQAPEQIAARGQDEHMQASSSTRQRGGSGQSVEQLAEELFREVLRRLAEARERNGGY